MPAGRVAEGGVGHERHPRIEPHPPRERRRSDGDRRQLLGIGPFRHRSIGDHYRAAPRGDDMHPERGRPIFVVDHPPHLAQRLAERAGGAGDHRVALAQRQHRRSKGVAVLVDHSLDLAPQHAVALVLGIEIVDRAPDQWRIAAVEHFIAMRVVDAEFSQLGIDFLAPDQHRRAIATLMERDRRAQHVGLFALGEQHPARIRPRPFKGEAEHRRGRVQSRAQLAAVGGHVGDRLLRHSAGHRRLGHRHRNDFDQARVERRGDDVFRPEMLVEPAIGQRHFLRHRLARQRRQRLGGGDLHLLVDPRRADIERAAEDKREAEHIVDLVGVIRPPGGDDRIGPRRLRFGRGDLRIGVGHGEDDR